MEGDPAAFRRRLLLLTAAALAVRAAFVLLEPATRPVADERTWTNWAIENLVTPKVRFNPLRTHMIFYPPLYPYFIAVTWLPFASLEAVKWAQVVLGAALVPVVGSAALRVFGPRVAVMTAAAIAFWPELVWFSAHFWSETLFLLLLWAAWERMLAASATGGRGAAVAAGVLWGLSILTRETALYFTPVAALWLGWPRDGRWRAAGALFLSTAALTVAPWTIRNVMVFDALVPVSTAGGQNLFQGNCPIERDETYRMVDEVKGRIEQWRYARDQGMACIMERQPAWAFEKLREQMPNFWEADSLVLIHLKRGAYGPYPRWVALVLLVVVLLPFVVVMPAFAAGLARVPFGAPPGAAMLAAFLVYHNALHVATHGFARYRLPVLPIVLMLAAWWWTNRREPRPPRLRALSAVLVAVALLVLVPSLVRNWHDPAYGLSSAPDPAGEGHDE